MSINPTMKLTFLILISFIILSFPVNLFGQSFNKNMKSDDVTDEQVAQIKARLTADGMTVADFEAQALAAGAAPAEVAKMSTRLSQSTDVTAAPVTMPAVGSSQQWLTTLIWERKWI